MRNASKATIEYERVFGLSPTQDVSVYLKALIARLRKTPNAKAGFINCDLLGVARFDNATCEELLQRAVGSSVFPEVKEILNS